MIRNPIYRLNRKIKPGTPVPIGEIKLPGARRHQLVPVTRIESEDSRISQVSLGINATVGSELRFITILMQRLILM